MFHSLEYTKYLGYDEKTKLNSHEYNLTDSDFSCVVLVVALVAVEVEVGAVMADGAAVGVVIQEYSKRNLNVAYNLLLYFQWYEKLCDWPIADQIEWAERTQPLFTPQIKADVQKYLLLL